MCHNVDRCVGHSELMCGLKTQKHLVGCCRIADNSVIVIVDYDVLLKHIDYRYCNFVCEIDVKTASASAVSHTTLYISLQ